MKPEKYDYVQNQMNSLVYKVRYSKDIYEPSIAYTWTRSKTLCGTIYRVFVNNTDKELSQFLYMHECGHIIFAHTKNMDMREDRFLLAKIQAAYSKVAYLFPVYSKYLKIFRNAIFNIVMDFEVNSRLFNKEEWDFMNKRVSKLLGEKSKGMWPEDYGFSCGLTWNEYLNLILQNPREFLKKFKEQCSRKKNGSFGNENAGSFDGNLSQAEYEQIKENASAMSEEELSEMEKEAAEHSEGTFDVPNGQMKGRSSQSNETVHIDFVTYKNQDELLKNIMKLLHLKKRTETKRDNLFNYNRRKYGTDLIIPKNLSQENIASKKLYLLIDVSGSVDSEMVSDFINTFYQVKRNFKNTIITTWNTHLVAQWNISEPIKNDFGGGTDIGKGIKFLSDNERLRSKDILFVISDFEDDLENWSEKLKKLKCQKFAINWNKYSSYINPGFKKILIKD